MTAGQTTTQLERSAEVTHADGSSEIAGFVGSPGEAIFSVIHRPAGPSGVGVVICAPVHSESIDNYRREVVLGRTLASAGISAIRFHYRGTGNSGDVDELTIASMVDDATTASATLAEVIEGGRCAFLGTRVGAVVAGVAAPPGAPVVLWQPVTNPAAYFRAMFRSRAIGALTGAVNAVSSATEELRQSGELDVFGFLVSEAFHDSVTTTPLADALGSVPRPTLIVQMHRSSDIQPEFSKLATRLRSAGLDVTVAAVVEEPRWWFARERWESIEDREETKRIAVCTIDWLRPHLGIHR